MTTRCETCLLPGAGSNNVVLSPPVWCCFPRVIDAVRWRGSISPRLRQTLCCKAIYIYGKAQVGRPVAAPVPMPSGAPMNRLHSPGLCQGTTRRVRWLLCLPCPWSWPLAQTSQLVAIQPAGYHMSGGSRTLARLCGTRPMAAQAQCVRARFTLPLFVHFNRSMSWADGAALRGRGRKIIWANIIRAVHRAVHASQADQVPRSPVDLLVCCFPSGAPPLAHLVRSSLQLPCSGLPSAACWAQHVATAHTAASQLPQPSALPCFADSNWWPATGAHHCKAF